MHRRQTSHLLESKTLENFCTHRKQNPLTKTLWPLLLTILGIISCNEAGVSSRVIEFCTPLSSDQGSVPQVAAVIDPTEQPPPGSEAINLLVGTEYPLTTLDATMYAEVFGTAPLEADEVQLKRINLAVVDNRSTIPDPSNTPVVGRAIFKNFRSLIMGLPPLGPNGETTQYRGILGGDLLRRYAVRLYYGEDPECILPWNPEARFPTVKFIQEYSDDSKDLASDGFAVWRFSLAGGGQILLNDKTVNFGATRVTVGACVEPEPFTPENLDPNTAGIDSLEALEARIPITGEDAFLLVATGTLPIVLGEHFFHSVEAQGAQREPPVEYSGTSTTLHTINSKTPALSVDLTRVILVGSVSDDGSPCRELALRRKIAWIRHWLPKEAWSEGDFHIDSLGAPVAEYDSQRDPLAPKTPLRAFVVSDTSKLLQGLRFETSLQIPNIDGFVGHEFLKHFETIIDYPGGRILFRCIRYTPPENTSCPSLEDLGDSICCETNGRCFCPASQPCCSYPMTKKP